MNEHEQNNEARKLVARLAELQTEVAKAARD